MDQTTVQIVSGIGAGLTGVCFLFFGVLVPYFSKKFAPPPEPEPQYITDAQRKKREEKRMAEAKNQAVKLLMAFFIACAATAVAVGVVIDNVGYGPVMASGFALTGICIIVLIRTKNFKTAQAASITMGLGAMACSVGANSLFPKVLRGGTEPEAAMNLGNVFFALGCILFPLFIDKLNFRKHDDITDEEQRAKAITKDKEYKVMAVAVVFILVAVFALIAQYPEQKVGFSFTEAAGLIYQIPIIISAIALFCYIALESTFNQWLKTAAMEIYARKDPLKSEGFGGLTIVVFSIAMIASRLTASQTESIKSSGSYIIAGLGIAAAIIIYLLTKADKNYKSMIFAFLAGASFGPCFPTIVGMTMKKFNGMDGTIFGIIFSVGLVGAIVMPNLLNQLAKKKGISTFQAFKYLIPYAVILAVLALVLGWVKASS